MTKKLKYFHNLDGLRGIAAFSVLIFHFFHDARVTKEISEIELIRNITEIMQHGVTLFFVLSGFVITRILINTKGNNNYFSRFYKNRILRIFPLYYLYLVVHFFVFPTIIGNGPNLEFSKQLPIYFYLQNMGWLTGLEGIGPGHFWSLAVEEHFYLAWPLILFFTPKKKLKVLTLLLIALSVPIKIFFLINDIDINSNTFSRYDSIMIGCFIAALEFENDYQLPKLSTKNILFTLLTIFGLGLVLHIFQEHVFMLKSSLKHLILGLFFGYLIYYFISINKGSLLSNLLTTKPMQYFGKISYGLYVWHMMAITIVSLLQIGNWSLNLSLVVIITISLAHFSYFIFERHFLKLK